MALKRPHPSHHHRCRTVTVPLWPAAVEGGLSPSSSDDDNHFNLEAAADMLQVKHCLCLVCSTAFVAKTLHSALWCCRSWTRRGC